MNIIFFSERNILPLTYTRPVADLRVGILTISEKWQKFFTTTEVSFLEETHLSEFFTTVFTNDNLYINANFCPSEDLMLSDLLRKKNISLWQNEKLVLLHTSEHFSSKDDIIIFAKKHTNALQASELSEIFFPWDIFLKNKLPAFSLTPTNNVSVSIPKIARKFSPLKNDCEKSGGIKR